jgi:hypothetical protein
MGTLYCRTRFIVGRSNWQQGTLVSIRVYSRAFAVMESL